MSDTPETDLHEYEFVNHDDCAGETIRRCCDGKDVTWDDCYSGTAVPSTLARKLERQRNLLREEMKRLKDHAKRYRMRAEELEKDLAEARRIAEDFHAMGVDGQGLPPLPWK